MALGEGDEVVAARHRAVVVHDLADHSRGREAGEPCQVDRGLGVAGALERAAVARDQREHMARCHDVLRAARRIDRHSDGARAVGGGNAGGHALARLDGDGKGRLVTCAVVLRHQGQTELLDPLAGEREADQAARMLGHEVDRFGGGALRGDHEIALVLAILVIDQDEHPALAGFLDYVLGSGLHFGEGDPPSVLFERAHDFSCSNSRAT